MRLVPPLAPAETAVLIDACLRDPTLWDTQRPPSWLPDSRPTLRELPRFWYREPGLWLPLSCAIAFVRAVDGLNNSGLSTNLTFAFDGTGCDLLVVVFVGDLIGGANDVTTVVYATSQTMTLAVQNTSAGGNRFLYEYHLEAPATGTNNVVITVGSTHYILGGAAGYSGVNATGQPDNTTTNMAANITDTTLTSSLTPVADNCWIALGEGNYSANSAPGASTGATRRTFDAAFGTWGLFDSGAAITPAASYSMTTTRPGTGNSAKTAHVLASYAPATGAAGHPTMRRWGGTPAVGGQGVNDTGTGRGKMWGRVRGAGIVLPRWLQEQERAA